MNIFYFKQINATAKCTLWENKKTHMIYVSNLNLGTQKHGYIIKQSCF